MTIVLVNCSDAPQEMNEARGVTMVGSAHHFLLAWMSADAGLTQGQPERVTGVCEVTLARLSAEAFQFVKTCNARRSRREVYRYYCCSAFFDVLFVVCIGRGKNPFFGWEMGCRDERRRDAEFR